MKTSRPSAPADRSLSNAGVLVLNDTDRPLPRQRTLIVLGIARSGTTMVAGALHHLGIDMMGGRRPNPVFEDVEIGGALDRSDTSALRRLIAQRDGARDVWGWKRPAAVEQMARLERWFRNPEYIVVFRDLFAIANRNRISVQADVLDNMRQSLEQYGRLLELLARTQRRALLVSYEKAMLDKAAFARALAGFAGTGEEQIARVRRYIQRDSQAYLATSRNWGGRGRLARATPEVVSGWASWRDDVRPVTVQIVVNGRECATLIADQLRPNLQRGGQHPTGRCGFDYRPPAGSLAAGDVVTARIVGDVADLPGSPLTVQAPMRR